MLTVVTLVFALTSLVLAGGSTRSGALGSDVRWRLARNVAPEPDFNSSGYARTTGSGRTVYPNPCVATSKSGRPIFIVNARGPACTSYVLLAINRAHRAERIRPMVLPSNWYHLTTRQQLFVVADLERVDRGLPAYLGLNSALSAAAQRGAVRSEDPAIATGFSMSSMGATWAGASSVLEADYGWMYEDGWGGSKQRTSNIDCTRPSASGCWGHREVILGHYTGLNCTTCELGTGYALEGRFGASYTDLIESPSKEPPAMTFTWAKDVAPFLSSSSDGTTTTTTTTTTTSAPTSTSTSG